MTPTLVPGDEFVGSDTRVAVPGNVVAFPHPRRPNFWMVKRLKAIEGDTVVTDKGLITLQAGEAWVLSDNEDATGAQDSRTFGVVDRSSLMPMVKELDEEAFAEGIELLAGEDELLEKIVSDHGVPTFWKRARGFETLVLLILEQQVSLESGAAVFQRLRQHVGGDVTPERVALCDPSELNGIGVTRQKAGYVTGLARAIEAGDVELDLIAEMGVAEASETLRRIKGIGHWTADAYLLSAEGRPDVFPAGDRALQVGTGEVLGMTRPPDPAELEILSQPWKPIRAVAARLIWHAYLSRRGRVEYGD